ncbi:amidohydrolase, partial [Microbacterium resistens]|uniref:amidohydrolase n=1 Tax=Microbacterium resistens TaxID=156977 RepID=UPI001C5733A3
MTERSHTPQDVAVIGGRVLRDGRSATAVAIRDGRILLVGDDAEVRDAIGADAEVVDAEGGTILPGFDDAHTHVLSGALLRGALALSTDDDLGAVRAVIAEYAARTSGWIIGTGWHYRAFGGGTPTRQLLDELVGARPAYITAFDGHTSWVSTAALRLAGVTASTPDPEGGTIERDAAGEPTGILREKASALIHPVLERPRGADVLPFAADAMRELAAMGITSVQDPGSSPDELPLWAALRERGELTVRARLGLPLPVDADDAELARTLDDYSGLVADTADDIWIAGGTLKGFLDGVIETRTAALLEPYRALSASGDAFIDPERLTRLVIAANSRAWQVQLHAIGDRAVRIALDAYEAARRAGGRRIANRVEHIELCDPADLPRFGSLGVVASLQPLHAFCDAERVEAWDGLVGPQRSDLAWPAAQILAAGGTVALGSDWPVADCDPLAVIRAAVMQSNLHVGGRAEPSNALTMGDALSAYGEGGAAAADVQV